MNMTILLGGEIHAQEIFQAASALPFLGEKRFTIVKNFLSEAKEEEKAKMSELLEKIPDFSTLVLSETSEIDRRISLFKKIQKLGKLIEFPLLTGSKLSAWIEKAVNHRGSVIEKQAAMYLMEIVSGDLYRLENEIAKLTAYAQGRPITKRDIEVLVDIQFEASIFRLTDGIGLKNTKGALGTLHQLIETGEDLHRIFAMIIRQFRIIACVKDLSRAGLRRDEIAAKLHEHPFVISNTLSQTQNFSLGQIQCAYKLLIELDTKLKSGGIKIASGDKRDFVLALDQLVLELCN